MEITEQEFNDRKSEFGWSLLVPEGQEPVWGGMSGAGVLIYDTNPRRFFTTNLSGRLGSLAPLS